MTSVQFCYWLQGFFELRKAGAAAVVEITAPQAELVERHLALVFKHEIDPSQGPPAHQAALSEIHQGGTTATAKPLHPAFEPLSPPYGPGAPDGVTYRC